LIQRPAGVNRFPAGRFFVVTRCVFSRNPVFGSCKAEREEKPLWKRISSLFFEELLYAAVL